MDTGSLIPMVLDLPSRLVNISGLVKVRQRCGQLGSAHAANAVMHAMSTPGETAAQAEKAYDNYINKQLQSCTTEGLAKALHAAEDSAAAGHRNFHVWDGHLTFYHFWHDAVPTMDEFNTAVQRARAIITIYKKECACSK